MVGGGWWVVDVHLYNATSNRWTWLMPLSPLPPPAAYMSCFVYQRPAATAATAVTTAATAATGAMVTVLHVMAATAASDNDNDNANSGLMNDWEFDMETCIWSKLSAQLSAPARVFVATTRINNRVLSYGGRGRRRGGESDATIVTLSTTCWLDLGTYTTGMTSGSIPVGGGWQCFDSPTNSSSNVYPPPLMGAQAVAVGDEVFDSLHYLLLLRLLSRSPPAFIHSFVIFFRLLLVAI